MTFRDEKHENNLDIFESGDDFDVCDDLDIDDIQYEPNMMEFQLSGI